MREIHTDESYVHYHHRNDHENLFHPGGLEDDGKSQRKGRIFCFVAAMGGNGRIENAGVIPDSVWIFCPSQKDGHKGDYYKVFNRENYIQWFTTQLLSNLHEPSLIMLDNARYHKCKPISTPHPSK